MIKKIICSVTAFTVLLFAIPVCTLKISASSDNFTNIKITDIKQENGYLKGFTVSFDTSGGLASANSRISVNTQKFRKICSDNPYGDFTDYGEYTKAHNYSDWPDTPEDCGFVVWNSEGTFNRPGSGTTSVNVSFNDGQIAAGDNKTYYIYLWANYNNKTYPDAYLCEFVSKGDSFELKINSKFTAVLNVTGVNATLSKTDDIAEGETITVTISPLAGYTLSDLPTVTATNATAGTVSNNGNGTYSCEISNFRGDSFITVIANKQEEHIHSFSSYWSYNSASHWRSCSCGEKSSVSTHTWNSGTVTAPATETTEGVMTYTCTVCNATKTENIPITAHTHTPAADWTSDETGHWHICSGCDEKLDFSAHIWDNGTVTTPATETTEVIKTYTCTVCNATKTENIPITAHTHTPAANWTSDETGHWHICSGCDEKLDFAAHTWDNGTVTLEPTETTEGIKTYICTTCGAETAETLPPIPEEHTHEFSVNWSCDSTEHWHECACGEKSDTASHISNEGTVTVSPTYYSTGVKTYSCIFCGYVMYTETIPALRQDYYPNYYPVYNVPAPFVNTTPSYNFEPIRPSGIIKGNSVTINWNEIESADNYTIYELRDGKYKAIGTTTDTSYTTENLATGKYKFIVRYTVNGRLSLISKSVTLTADIKNSKPYPTAAVDGNTVTLKWQAVDNAEKYAVYLVKDGKAKKLKETDKRAFKYDLDPDKEYQFIVRAYVNGKWTAMLTSDIIEVSL